MKECNSNSVCMITSISWERINLLLEGFVENANLNQTHGVLVIKDTKNKTEILYKINIIDQSGHFVARLNISTLQEGLPLQRGIWSLHLRMGESQEDIEMPLIFHKDVESTKIFKYGKHRYIIYPYRNLAGYLYMEVINYRYISSTNKMKTTKEIIKKLRKFLFTFLYHFFCLFIKQREDWVLFASDSRMHLSGNMKFVQDKMIERNMNVKYKYAFKSKVSEFRSFKDKFKLPYYLAVSKTIFVDDYYPLIYPLKLREDTKLIQLWHAVGAFKTFGYSRVGKVGGPSPFSLNHRNYTHAIVSSREIAPYYAEGFGISEEKVFSTGIPRTDIFFDEEYKAEIIEKIYSQYPQLRDKKIITFAPTFRGKGAKSATYDYNKLDLESLAKFCMDHHAIVLFKMHPFIPARSIPEEYDGVFMDMSSYREINDLLFVTDILITDYSSTCFEFSLLDKPMLFYAYDLEEYIASRDFYYQYEDFVPGKICRTFDELLLSLEREDYEYEKVKGFKEKFFENTDGKSTSRVIDLVFGQEDNK